MLYNCTFLKREAIFPNICTEHRQQYLQKRCRESKLYHRKIFFSTANILEEELMQTNKALAETSLGNKFYPDLLGRTSELTMQFKTNVNPI